MTGVLISESLAPLVDLIYPPRCPLCGEGTATQGGLCPGCWGELVPPPASACSLCQDALLAARADAEICMNCEVNPPPHDGLTAATFYTDAARKLVLSLKHGRKLGVTPILARMIALQLPELEGHWQVVPVPLHRWRLWQRGFNQSALLGRELARLRDLPLLVDGLVRRRNTRSLSASRLGRSERAATLAGAIAVNPKRAAAIEGAKILLVDDVVTSGATTNACIAALRRGGAAKVKIACFARVPGQLE